MTEEKKTGRLPWMKWATRDWLDNKELRRCSPLGRAVLADLMCLAHEGTPYGFLSDKIGPLTKEYLASRCTVSISRFNLALTELVAMGRVHESAVCGYFIKRMVEDEDLRQRRASGGKDSVGHPNVPPPKSSEGYPSFKNDSRGRTDADSDSGSGVSVEATDLEKLSTRVRSPIPPIDHEFTDFIGHFLALGIEMSEADMRKCAMLWISLGLEDKLKALADVRLRAASKWATCAARYVPRPWNYLTERQWERVAVVRGRTEPETPAEAAQRQASEEFSRANPEFS